MAHVGILMETLQADLVRQAQPSPLSIPCAMPNAPRPQGNFTGTSLQFTDAGTPGMNSGDSLKTTYFYCGDSGLSVWNSQNSFDFTKMEITGNPLGSGDWTVRTNSTGGFGGNVWRSMLNADTGYQPGDRSHSVNGSFDGHLQRVGDKLISTMTVAPGDPNGVFDVDTLQLGVGSSIPIASRGISLYAQNPLVIERSATGARRLNPDADGVLGVSNTPLAWFQSTSVAASAGVQGASITVRGLEIDSPAQANARRAARGTVTIRPSIRYGYFIQIDVQSASLLRIRVISVDGLTVSDRMASWSDVLWDYRTAAN